MVSLADLVLGLVFVVLGVGGSIGLMTTLGWLPSSYRAEPSNPKASNVSIDESQLFDELNSTPLPVLVSAAPLSVYRSLSFWASQMSTKAADLKNAEISNRLELIRINNDFRNIVNRTGAAMIQEKVAAMEKINLGLDVHSIDS